MPTPPTALTSGPNRPPTHHPHASTAAPRRDAAGLPAARPCPAEAKRGEAGDAAVALEAGGGPAGRRHGDGAGDEEGQLGAALPGQPTGQDAGGRAGAVEGEVVEAGDAPTQVVGSAELKGGVRARRPQREGEAGREE